MQRDTKDQTPLALLEREDAESDAERDDWAPPAQGPRGGGHDTRFDVHAPTAHHAHHREVRLRLPEGETKPATAGDCGGGESAANHSRQMMQFSMAANRLVGESFSKGVEARLATGHQPGNIPPGSMLQGNIYSREGR